jgi:hypothetical protein
LRGRDQKKFPVVFHGLSLLILLRYRKYPLLPSWGYPWAQELFQLPDDDG